MELKRGTPLLIFIKIGISKYTFYKISNYLGLNPKVYHCIPFPKMNVVWGRINSNSNKVILGTYDDKQSLEYVSKRIFSRIYSKHFHIMFITHEDIDFENKFLKELKNENIDYDIILLQNKNFSKL